MDRNGEEIKIRGILIPVAWDEEGNVRKVAVFAPHEEEYSVEENREVDGIRSLLHQEIEVTGRVREEAGEKIITVIDCKRTEGRRETSEYSRRMQRSGGEEDASTS